MANVDYRIASDAGLVLVTMEGPTNIDDCMAVSRDLHADDRWSGRYDVIWDLRRITDLNLVPGNLETIVDEKREHELGVDAGTDVLVVGGLVEEAIAVLIRLLARQKNQRVAVHHTMQAALRDLGYERMPDVLGV